LAKLSDEDKRICRGGEFQLLGDDTEKVREPKEEIAQKGTSRK